MARQGPSRHERHQANFPVAGKFDVLILGAGAAGLACARKLLENNLKILIIEARDRAGGRMLSQNPPHSSMPIELGAEFIHGAPKSTLDLMRLYHLPFYDVLDHHLHWDGKTLSPLPDFFEKLEKINRKLAHSQTQDASVGQFLKSQTSLGEGLKKLYRHFIEGFQAADVDLISQQYIANSDDSSELNGAHMFRSVRGYSELVRNLSEDLERKDILKFNLSARRIQWRKGQVKVFCHSQLQDRTPCLTAAKVVIALPLGVLKSPVSAHSGLQWEPMPPGLDAILDSLEMGHVQRLVFRFRTRFWENLSKQKPLSFVHMQMDRDFPTWWTMAPLRALNLVAWQGGPRAREMAQWPREEKIQSALKTLSEWSGRSKSWLINQIESCETHDWSQDPYSLGAYSYVRVGGLSRSMQFTRPVTDTLFFAGEATASGAARGTVHGAIESGTRAAEQVLKTAKRQVQNPHLPSQSQGNRRRKTATLRDRAGVSV